MTSMRQGPKGATLDSCSGCRQEMSKALPLVAGRWRAFESGCLCLRH
jgi:hypothetical protein